MATVVQYSRGIRLTASGFATTPGRPLKVSAMTIYAPNTDTTVRLRDGVATDAIVWEAEADNAASSPPIVFDPPLRFFNKCYVEISGGANSSVSLAVCEP